MFAGWYLATAFSPGSAIPASSNYIMVYFSPKQSRKDIEKSLCCCSRTINKSICIPNRTTNLDDFEKDICRTMYEFFDRG
jgi:hypothetical protein